MIPTLQLGGLGRRVMAASGGGGGGVLPTFVATGGQVQSTSNINIAWPAGHAVGDLGIIFVQTANEIPATPSGWSLVGTSGIGTPGAAGAVALCVYYKFATSLSEAAAAVPASGNHNIGIMSVFSGVHASPIDVQQFGSGTTNAVSLPSVTTTGANRLIVSIVADSMDAAGARLSAWANASLASFTEAADFGAGTGTGGGGGAAYGGLATAGASGTGSATHVSAVANYISLTLALKPI